MSATVLSSRYRRAAHGLHRYWACGGFIGSRHQYLDLRMADGGTAYTLRLHSLCDWLWTDAGGDEDWSWSCGQDALSRWAVGFTFSLSGVAS